jgi:DNA processing protein
MIGEFPIRKRIMAGMALGVVAVERALYSGHQITTRLAMEFWGVRRTRQVTQPSSFGPHRLIQQGAKWMARRENVVEELTTPVRAEPMPGESVSQEERAARVGEHCGHRRALGTGF